MILLVAGGDRLYFMAILAIIALSASEMLFVPVYNAQTLALRGDSSPTYAMSLLSTTRGISEAVAAFIGTILIAHHHAVVFYIALAALCVLTGIWFLFGET